LNTINNQNINNEPLSAAAITNKNTVGASEPTFQRVLSQQMSDKQTTHGYRSLEMDLSNQAKTKGKKSGSITEENSEGLASDRAPVALNCPMTAQQILNIHTPLNNTNKYQSDTGINETANVAKNTQQIVGRLDNYSNQPTKGDEILPQLAINTAVVGNNAQQKPTNLATPINFSLDNNAANTDQASAINLPESLSTTINAPKINEASTTKSALSAELSISTQSNPSLTTEIVTPQFAAMPPSITAPMLATSAPVKTENAYLDTANWQHEVGQKVIWMNNGGHHSATLMLDSPDLGPLQVVIKVNGAQHAEASFISDNLELRQILTDSMLHLRDAMKQSGIELGTTNIQSGGNNQQSFNPPSQNAAYLPAKNKSLSNRLIQQTTVATAHIRTQKGMVNTFA